MVSQLSRVGEIKRCAKCGEEFEVRYASCRPRTCCYPCMPTRDQTDSVVARLEKDPLRWSHIRSRAKNRKQTFTVSKARRDELTEQALEGVCDLTDIPFDTDPNNRGDFSPSVDRINTRKGYTDDNVRVVLKIVNVMRGSVFHDNDDLMWRVIGAMLIKANYDAR